MKFKIMNKTGDAVLDYDREIAEMKFNELKEANMIPMVAEPNSGKLATMNRFNPEVEEVTWVPKIAGG